MGIFSTGDATEILQKESIIRITKAMSLLIMTLTTPTCRVIIHTSKTANLDWSTGLTWDIMTRLKGKYKPDDTVSAVELNSRLNRLKIKESDHPDLLFDRLAEINIVYGYQLDSVRQISEIMEKAPKKYTNTLAYTENLTTVTNEALTLDYLQHTLNKFCRIEHGDDSDREDEDEDEKNDIVATGVGLAIDDKKNEITYFKCSKIGHYD